MSLNQSDLPLTPSSPQPSHLHRLNLWRLLMVLLPGLFIGFMLAVTIDPVGDALASAVHCLGAVSTSRDEISGGTQRLGPTSAQKTGTKTVSLNCLMSDGSIKTIGNDTLAVTRIVGGALAGALIEIVLIGFWWLRRTLTRNRA